MKNQEPKPGEDVIFKKHSGTVSEELNGKILAVRENSIKVAFIIAHLSEKDPRMEEKEIKIIEEEEIPKEDIIYNGQITELLHK